MFRAASLAATFALPIAAQAGLIAYDGFESYDANTALNGGAGGSGWAAPQANWSAFSNQVSVQSESLSYSNGSVNISGGSRAAQLADFGASGDAEVVASRSFASQTGDVWMSMLFRPVSAATNDFVQFRFDNDTTLINGAATFGDLNASGNSFGVRTYDSGGLESQSAGGSYLAGTTYFLVARLSKSGTSSPTNYDLITLYVNPNTGGEPTLPAHYATKLELDFGSGIDSVSHFAIRTINLQASSDELQFDELRVGTSYVGVIPEPASLSLLGMGATLFLRRRRN